MIYVIIFHIAIGIFTYGKSMGLLRHFGVVDTKTHVSDILHSLFLGLLGPIGFCILLVVALSEGEKPFSHKFRLW